MAVKFDLPSGYEVKLVPDNIPSIYNGDKTVVYGLLMAKSTQKDKKIKCQATLTGDIVGKKFKFDIPFELPAKQAEGDVAVIHQLAVKKMIQEWQDNEEPYENIHKQEITALSCDASVVSKYTAYVAVDEAQNKPVSGSMQGYELTATDVISVDLFSLHRNRCKVSSRPLGAKRTLRSRSLPKKKHILSMAPPPALGSMFGGSMSGPPSPPPPEGIPDLPPRVMASDSCLPPYPPTRSALFDDILSLQPTRSACNSFCFDQISDEDIDIGSSTPSQTNIDLLGSISSFSAQTLGPTAAPAPPKQSDSSFIVGLQQANGSWLLNDQLAGALAKSVEELKKCCPVSCDVKIWSTLVAIEFLKKKYPLMMEELELVIMKAEQWLGKQVLPADVDLAVLKDCATKVF